MAGGTLTLADLARSLAAGAAALPAAVPKFLSAASILIGGELKQDLKAGRSPDGTPYRPLAHPRPSSKGGDIPLNDEGLLGASLAAGPGHVERIAGATLEVGTNLAGAATHQYGATIVPKTGQYLAIPLTPAAKSAGGPRQYPAPLVGHYGQKGGVLVDPAKGNEAQFALAKKVTVPARPFVGFSVACLGKLKQLGLAIFGGATGLTRG